MPTNVNHGGQESIQTAEKKKRHAKAMIFKFRHNMAN
jgi:hypothetical protein